MLSRALPPFVVLATLFVCLCVHELGHVIAAHLTGGTVTQIALFSLPPHIRIVGDGSNSQEAFRAIAGSACYLLVYAAFILLKPRRAWTLTEYAASLFAAVEILGWVMSALVGTAGSGPNDASRFLEVSGASPYVLAAAAATLGVTGALCVRSLRRRAPIHHETVRVLAKTATGGI